MDRRLKNIGDWGEEQACFFLRRKGFEIVERNFHTPAGELDIVAVKGGDYYFVEVKTRQSSIFANDLAISYIKKRRLEKSVKSYCYRRGIANVSLIMAGLIVHVDKWKKKVNFRFVVLL